MQKDPHLKIEAKTDCSRVIVCGAPERAELISKKMSSVRMVGKNREYHSYLGEIAGKPVLTVSHGVGAAGATICFRELIQLGAKTIIRVGTAGGLQKDSKIGDIVIAEAAIREEGVTSLMVPSGYPATADPDLTVELRKALSKTSARSGIVLTTDLFYPEVLPRSLELYSKAGVLAVEMECSALFVLARLHQIRAAAVLCLDGNPLEWDEGSYAPDSQAQHDALATAIDASLSVIAR